MLEVKIEELTKAVIVLNGNIEALLIAQMNIVQAEKPIEIPQTSPVITESPVAPVMPAAPTFEPACPTHDVAKAPFTDGKGLIDYVMTAYKEMGAEKGAQIQGVLVEMGLQNVNELRPTEYDAFFAKVEALK